MVQGVSFRYCARQKAEQLGIVGWARNCPDQSLEIMICGGEESMASFTTWARTGPTDAQVQKIEMRPVDPPLEEFTTFIIE